MDYSINERIVGKTKSVLGIQGTIRQILVDGPKRKYVVAFDNGREIVCATNSFQKITGAPMVSTPLITHQASMDEDIQSEGPDDIWEHGSTMSTTSSSDEDDELGSSSESDSSSTISDDNQEGLHNPQIDIDPLLSPHGRIWTTKLGITIDSNLNDSYKSMTKLKFNNVYLDKNGDKNLVNYFLLLFPMDFLAQTIIPLTNQSLVDDRKSPVDMAEILKFFGLTLTMALDPVRGGVNAYWSTESELEDTIYQSRNYYDRFKMSRDRFKDIRKCLTLAENPHYQQVVGQPDEDPWWPIRPFITAFNSNRKKSVEPGSMMTVDEVMSMWYGLDKKDAVEGLPHVTKIIRKPRGIGAEMKAICDGESNIMMGLEVLEGATRQAAKPYTAEYGASTGVTMRLALPWAGSGRTIVADSAFLSVKTLSALYSELGLYFMGIIKTAHREYPKKYLNNWYELGWDPNPRRQIGLWKLLESTLIVPNSGASISMYALGWHDIKLKTIISNRGTTLAGNPSKRYRHKKVIINGEECTVKTEKLIPRPHMMEMFYKYFSVIDIHDHYRQGSLRMEESWKTRKWWHRIFGTILGIIFTDCYYAYRMEQVSQHKPVAQYDIFLGRLAKCLIFNIYMNNVSNNIILKPSSVSESNHPLCNLLKHPYFAHLAGTNSRARLHCRKCSVVVSTFCYTCSDANATNPRDIYAVCKPTVSKSCYFDHMCISPVISNDA